MLRAQCELLQPSAWGTWAQEDFWDAVTQFWFKNWVAGAQICFCRASGWLREMLPSAGVYYFPWEINSSIPEGEALRTFGRLSCYDLARSEATLSTQHGSAQHHVHIDTTLVEPFEAQLGSLYMVLGEAERREGESPVIKARILTCVEGMNMPLLEQAIQEQRKYFQERQQQMESGMS
ncbi:CST complex subunit TEN1 isoform X1 [Centrocercus urophasianus]|uniref:CST complex subunit TEN1 isoform X1 n=2 Tax=Centrocercus urophasianus TaxID=9002 RepID=UPI001C647963|nr:CST complex subunit TEN1 isoform X1 [Centrocercus urophasianus]